MPVEIILEESPEQEEEQPSQSSILGKRTASEAQLLETIDLKKSVQIEDAQELVNQNKQEASVSNLIDIEYEQEPIQIDMAA